MQVVHPSVTHKLRFNYGQHLSSSNGRELRRRGRPAHNGVRCIIIAVSTDITYFPFVRTDSGQIAWRRTNAGGPNSAQSGWQMPSKISDSVVVWTCVCVQLWVHCYLGVRGCMCCSHMRTPDMPRHQARSPDRWLGNS